MNRRSLGYIPYEMIVTLLVVTILLGTSMPKLRVATGATPEREAVANSQRISEAIRAIQSGERLDGFNRPEMSIERIERELGGKVPTNPCTGGNSLAIDYGMVLGPNTAVLQAEAGDHCLAEALPKISLTVLSP